MDFYDNHLNRRCFIGIMALLFSGCSTFSKSSELNSIVKGFNVYTKKNPHMKWPHVTDSSWYDNLRRHGYRHTGESYALPSGEPIVASAAGKIIEAGVHFGSGDSKTKESGDRVKILHEDGYSYSDSLTSVYYHMKSNSTPVSVGQNVNRGDIIGYEGGPFGFKVKHYLANGRWIREQVNNWGNQIAYMQYWDYKTELDLTPDIVTKRKFKRYSLMSEFNSRYIGPEKEKIATLSSDLIHKGYRRKENMRWSNVEVFKLAKYIFNKQPELFKGSFKSNISLLDEIYANQPVTLTIPFRTR